MPGPMQPPVPGNYSQMDPSSMMGNPQMFAQLLQQMGAAPPNLQGAGQVPMPGMGSAGAPGQGGGMPGQMPPPAGGMGAMPPQGQMPPPSLPPQGGMPTQGQMPPGGQMPPPPGVVQPGGMPPPGAPPAPPPAQMPPQMQQMMQQIMQQRQQQAGQQMGQPAQQHSFTPQELGALGRYGDTTVAHLTPGEITVPPQVQSPKILATLNKEYHKKGVDPSQFTVGSPNSSINPNTGVPEYNFWSSVLPMALGLAGSAFLGPEMLGVGGMLGTGLSGLTSSAIGGGLGTTLGGLVTGQNPMNAALTGIGSGLGGYALGSLMSPAASAAAGTGTGTIAGGGSVALPASAVGANVGGDGPLTGAQMGNVGTNMPLAAAQGMPGGVPSELPQMSQMASNSLGTPAALQANPGILGDTWLNKLIPQNITDVGQTIGSTAGGALGNMLAGSIISGNQPVNPFAGQPSYKNASQLPDWQTLIGQTGYKGPKPNFTGYNPATNYPAAFNFFPTTAPATTS